MHFNVTVYAVGRELEFRRMSFKLSRRSKENLRKTTELEKIVGKSYDDADFRDFLRKS